MEEAFDPKNLQRVGPELLPGPELPELPPPEPPELPPPDSQVQQHRLLDAPQEQRVLFGPELAQALRDSNHRDATLACAMERASHLQNYSVRRRALAWAWLAPEAAEKASLVEVKASPHERALEQHLWFGSQFDRALFERESAAWFARDHVASRLMLACLRCRLAQGLDRQQAFARQLGSQPNRPASLPSLPTVVQIRQARKPAPRRQFAHHRAWSRESSQCARARFFDAEVAVEAIADCRTRTRSRHPDSQRYKMGKTAWGTGSLLVFELDCTAHDGHVDFSLQQGRIWLQFSIENG